MLLNKYKYFNISLALHFSVLIFSLLGARATLLKPAPIGAKLDVDKTTNKPVVREKIVQAALVDSQEIAKVAKAQQQREVKRQEAIARDEKKVHELEQKLATMQRQQQKAQEQKAQAQAQLKKATKEREQLKQEQEKIKQESKALTKEHEAALQKVQAAKQAAQAAEQAAKLQQEQQEALIAKETVLFATKIRDKIVQNRNTLLSFPQELSCDIKIRLSSEGDLINVALEQSSGNLAYDEIQIKAIYKAAPFSMPLDPELAKKITNDIVLTFKNDDEVTNIDV